MKSLYLSIVLLSFFSVKAQQNVIMEALDAPDLDPAFSITSCTVSTVGFLGKGLPAQSADIAANQIISVNVTVPGPYSFTTGAVNGVTFSASGTFTNSGVQNVTLAGTGSPTNYSVDNSTFAYTVTNTTATDAGSCSFTRKVYQPDQNYTGTIRNDGQHRFLYKVITGPGDDEWLQTNLGSKYNKVGDPDFDPEAAATNVDDYKAFGSLFQLGRNSDGHELLEWTSPTTATGLSTTSTPAPAPTTNVNTGLFYISSDGTRDNANSETDPETGNYYGRKTLNVPLKRYTIGPGDPCPSGFGIADESKYGTANYNAGATAWLNNPLKLVAPEMYRNAGNGNLMAYGVPRRLMRTSGLALYPTMTAMSPEFVIEGGILMYSNTTLHQDRRLSGTASNAAFFDPRGTLDGYPVRCMRPAP